MKKLRRTYASTAHTTGVKGSPVAGAGARNGLSRLVTTALRKPTTPVAGAAAWVTGAGGATAAAAAAVVNASPIELVLKVLDIGSPVGGVTVSTISVAVEASTASMTVDGSAVGDTGALTSAEVFGFETLSTGFDAVCSDLTSTSDSNGGVLSAMGSIGSTGITGPLATTSGSEPSSVDSEMFDAGFEDSSDLVVLGLASSLLLIVTPDSTSLLDDVPPDSLAVSVADVPVVVDVDPVVDADLPSAFVEVDVVDAPRPESGAGPADLSPEGSFLVDDELDELAEDPLPADEELDELAEEESDDVPVVSAADTP